MQGARDVTRFAEVRLAVPAAPQFVRLVRLAAADIGARAGFGLDEIDDLRMAVDELCFALTGLEGREGEIEVRFALAGPEVILDGSGRFSTPGAPIELSPHTVIRDQILGSVLDEHALEADADPPTFHGRKRRADA